MAAHLRLLLVCSLAGVALVRPAHGIELVRGPYLQLPTRTSMVVTFDLDEEALAEVRYGETSLDWAVVSAQENQRHNLVLDGLRPGRDYRYAVYVDDEPLTEERGFVAAPTSQTPFTFLVFGDTRSNHDDHDEVIGMMLGESAELLLHTGDLTSSGDSESQWDTFFSIEQPLLERLPICPVVGNHDETDGRATLFDETFALPGTELYYSFDYANAHFVFLDQYVNAEPICVIDEALVDGCLDAQQRYWLENDLQGASERAGIEHIFVVAHSGPYSSKSGRSGSGQLRALLPLFQEVGVTAIFGGHDHYYERGNSGNGIPYFITGGGGAPLYTISDPSDDPHTVALNSEIHHYLVVEVTGAVVRVDAKNVSGVIFDQTTIQYTPPEDGSVPLTEFEGGCYCAAGDGSPRKIASTILVLGLALLAANSRRRTGV